MALSALFILCTFALLIYAGFMLRNSWFLGRLPLPVSAPSVSRLPFVTVLVPARNEADHLPACLQALLEQKYPLDRYEIILIDDQSSDATPGLGRLFSVRYDRVSMLQTDPNTQKAHKKAAITLGVGAAKGEIILQTDADCIVGPGWMQALVQAFGPRTGLVAGPVFLRGEGSLFAHLQSLEGVALAGIGAGSMLAGRPNMVNGANLAYRKVTFEAVGGFQGVDNVASGDDELLMQKIHLHADWTVAYCGQRAAIVETSVQPTWQAFRDQRLRWVSKARQYLDRRINLIQGIAYLAYLSIPLSLLVGAYHQDLRYLGFAAQSFFLLWLANTLVAYRAGLFFHTLRLLRYSFLLQVLHIPYVLWIGIRGNFVQRYQWKGRTVS